MLTQIGHPESSRRLPPRTRNSRSGHVYPVPRV